MKRQKVFALALGGGAGAVAATTATFFDLGHLLLCLGLLPLPCSHRSWSIQPAQGSEAAKTNLKRRHSMALRLVLLLQLVQLLLCSLFHGTSGFPRQPHECWKTVPAFELLDFFLELLAGPGDPATLATLIPAVYSRHFPLRGAKDCRHSCRCCFCLWTNFDLTEGYSNCGVDSEASCLSA